MARRIHNIKEFEKEQWNKVDKIAVFSAGVLFILCILSIIQHLKNG